MICLSEIRCWPWSVSSSRSEVWKRPYNAKAPVYMSVDGSTYYVGHNWGAWRVNISERTIEHICDPHSLFKERAEKRKETTTFTPAKNGPRPSRLYEKLNYVGVFSVLYQEKELRGKGRGSDVAFFSPQQWPEGESTMFVSCG